jgi:Flp pilus assembly protein CpaB
VKTSNTLFFLILGLFATFLLCAGASIVGVTMSYARPYRFNWANNAPSPRTSVVMVAQEDMPAGTRIAVPEAKFRVRIYRLGEEPRNVVTDYNQLRGVTLKQPLREGDVCTISHVQKLALPLPDGKDAILFQTTLNINDDAVHVGNRLDVSGPSPVNEMVAGAVSVLAHDVQVLFVDPAPLPPPPQRMQTTTVSIVVAVSPDEAKALIGSMQRGALTVNVLVPKN